jgi:hypothetical protein
MIESCKGNEGVTPMANKTSFTPDEWKLLMEGVTMAGIAVTAAEPSGIWGTLKESFSSAHAMVSGKSGQSELVKALVTDFETSDGRGIAREGLKEQLKNVKIGDVKAKSVDTLRQVGALLDAKAPDEAAAVKTWLMGISQSVAEASSEGGFLGIGGVKVSDAEKATLGEIKSALRI